MNFQPTNSLNSQNHLLFGYLTVNFGPLLRGSLTKPVLFIYCILLIVTQRSPEEVFGTKFTCQFPFREVTSHPCHPSKNFWELCQKVNCLLRVALQTKGINIITQKISTWLYVHRWFLPQNLLNSCQLQFFKTEETSAQGNRNSQILLYFQLYSDYTINISVAIGSMMAASKKTLQFISVSFLKHLITMSFKLQYYLLQRVL